MRPRSGQIQGTMEQTAQGWVPVATHTSATTVGSNARWQWHEDGDCHEHILAKRDVLLCQLDTTTS